MTPEDIKHVLHDNFSNYVKNVSSVRGMDVYFRELMGPPGLAGIFAVDGDEWRFARKSASHLFSATQLTVQMETTFVAHTHKLIAVLRDCAARGVEFDVQLFFASFTFDTMCEVAFDYDPGALAVAARGDKLPFLVSFDFAQAVCSNRITQPHPWWRLCRVLGIGDEGKLPGHIEVLMTTVTAIVRRRLAEMAAATATSATTTATATSEGSSNGGSSGSSNPNEADGTSSSSALHNVLLRRRSGSGAGKVRNDLLSLFIKNAQKQQDPARRRRMLSEKFLSYMVLNFMIGSLVFIL